MELLQRQIKWGGARGSEAKSKAGRLRRGSEQQAPTNIFLPRDLGLIFMLFLEVLLALWPWAKGDRGSVPSHCQSRGNK